MDYRSYHNDLCLRRRYWIPICRSRVPSVARRWSLSNRHTPQGSHCDRRAGHRDECGPNRRLSLPAPASTFRGNHHVRTKDVVDIQIPCFVERNKPHGKCAVQIAREVKKSALSECYWVFRAAYQRNCGQHNIHHLAFRQNESCGQ